MSRVLDNIWIILFNLGFDKLRAKVIIIRDNIIQEDIRHRVLSKAYEHIYMSTCLFVFSKINQGPDDCWRIRWNYLDNARQICFNRQALWTHIQPVARVPNPSRIHCKQEISASSRQAYENWLLFIDYVIVGGNLGLANMQLAASNPTLDSDWLASRRAPRCQYMHIGRHY